MKNDAQSPLIGRADLHTHTTASDGLQSPEDNVRMAKEAGLAALAITDHDTIAGIDEALEAGEKYGIVVVPGIELSTVANGKDIHVLGYGYRTDNAMWLQRLERQMKARDRRNAAILEMLTKLGMPVSADELTRAATTGDTSGSSSKRKNGSVGRPHIARAMVDKGYVSDIREAFDRWIGEDKPAYASEQRISPLEAISWIHEAGGTAIIAHPGLYGDDGLVSSLLDGAADGVEAYHSDHDHEEERRYAGWAEERGKIVTGGSDFHGISDGKSFHGAIGSRIVDMSVVKRLLGLGDDVK
ncbi:PHP domain-containing protein [Cohnella soli]|uniref:PHP domain-containing protein n=1 Tax=Cohnella soli TaxID=425005 RepID=A0ABW0HMU4_9BACL